MWPHPFDTLTHLTYSIQLAHSLTRTLTHSYVPRVPIVGLIHGVQREGFGVLTFADGSRYSGKFANGMCEGSGVLSFPGETDQTLQRNPRLPHRHPAPLCHSNAAPREGAPGFE
jgi:hypothetical protein